jgi:predicted ATP-dependent protease
MTTALVSVFTGIPVRADVAMTGEITLRGEVLPIGGLKEKLLAAQRGGIKTVLIPEQNVKDLADIPDNVKNKLEIVPVRWIEKVLEVALERQPEADRRCNHHPAKERQRHPGRLWHLLRERTGCPHRPQSAHQGRDHHRSSQSS